MGSLKGYNTVEKKVYLHSLSNIFRKKYAAKCYHAKLLEKIHI
jgi:hypothetical protein